MRALLCTSVRLAVVATLLAAAPLHTQDSAGDTNAQATNLAPAAPAAGTEPANLPARFYTGHGWTFLAAYDFLDSNLSEGSENGACTLCLGRDGINGWHFAGARMFTGYFGVGIDYSGHNTHGCYSCALEPRGVDIDEDNQFFLGGITLVKPMGKHVHVFGQAFAGAMLAGARRLGPGRIPIIAIGHHFGPAMDVGGGVDFMISRRWGIRLFEFDYIGGDFNMTTTGAQGQWGPVNDFRVAAGVVMHLGGPK